MAAWSDPAVCATVDPELFFNPHQNHVAKRVCAECPIRLECLERALLEESGIDDDEFRHGVRGGLTSRERLLIEFPEKAMAA